MGSEVVSLRKSDEELTSTGIVSPLSVVIPAHNEEAVLPRCLESLLAEPGQGNLEIVVVANGCTDRTVEVARGFGPGVTVVELAESSKTAALNAGDAVATLFPRAYVDADIVVSTAALRAVSQAMEQQGALVGAPQPVMDFEGSPPPCERSTGCGVSCRGSQKVQLARVYTFFRRRDMPGSVHSPQSLTMISTCTTSSPSPSGPVCAPTNSSFERRERSVD